MPKVIITASVEDAKKWEKGFRTHADLFRKQTSTSMDFTVTDDNVAVLCTEVTDLDKFKKVIASQETAEAMAVDGVKRGTVQIYSLDKDLPL